MQTALQGDCYYDLTKYETGISFYIYAIILNSLQYTLTSDLLFNLNVKHHARIAWLIAG